MTSPTGSSAAPIHGWLAIDKGLGASSARVVAEVKRLTGAHRVGHGGTLDPLATGVLPVALGEATKTVQFAIGLRKTYRFAVRFGEARNTDDAEGDVIATSAVRPTRAALEAALPRFTGEIEQVPPAFSAIKVAGQRAYRSARQGQSLTLASRRIWVERLSCLGAEPDEAEFEMVCGKGAYVRALARDLAAALGTVGYVSKLRRSAVGPFTEAAAISLETLQTVVHSAALARHLFSVEVVLADIPALTLTVNEANRLRNGQAIKAAVEAAKDGLVRVRCEERLIAIAALADGLLRPVRVFNL